MNKIYHSIDELVGNTPLFELKNIERKLNLNARLLAKLEFFNPAGSVKDRIAREMFLDAEKSGKINKSTVIIEPTSGNAGIGIASIGAAKGYRVIIVMPETMSIERQMLMKAYGAELVLSDGKKGMAGAVEKADEIQRSTPNSVVMGQFINPANPDAHYKTTGPEIFEATNGSIDFFIAGIGTGGTITGVGKFLKEKNPNIKIIAVEPIDSPLLSEGTAGPHGIQGIGANFIPEVLDTSIYDSVSAISLDDAYKYSRLLGSEEGLLAGISSGAALAAGIEIAMESQNKDKTVVVLLPDTGERYLSTPLFR